MKLELIQELTKEGEIQYAPTPPSGRGNNDIHIKKEDIINKLGSISIRKPLVMIVGSVATQGESDNDLDIVIRGEDFSPKLREAIDFRLYRLFSDILGCDYDDVTKYVHIHYNDTGSYTSYIPIYELDLVPISNPEVIKMTRVPLELKGNFKILNKGKKKEKGRRIIAGYANVAVLDSDNQYIPPEVLKKGLNTLLDDPSYANLMVVHKNIQIGKILPEYNGFTTHVDDKGLFIIAEIRSDIKTADEIWEAILNKEINGFSIGLEVLSWHDKCDNNSCITVLDEINIFEVSVCSRPVNEESGFIILSKSKVCNECEEKDDTMSEEIEEKIEEIEEKDDTIEEEKTETAEKKEEEDGEEDEEEDVAEEKKESLEDRVAKLERSVLALEKMIQEFTKKYPMPKEPGKYPYPDKYPYPKKKEEEKKSEENEKDSDNLTDRLSKIEETLSKVVENLEVQSKIEELEQALKARDDAIKALEKKITINTAIVNKSSEKKKEEEVEIKTLSSEGDVELEDESPLIVSRGEIYSRDYV